MILIEGFAAVLDVVAPMVDGKGEPATAATIPTRIVSGGVSRDTGGVRLLLGHDPSLEAGEVVDLWKEQRDGRTLLGMRARVWDSYTISVITSRGSQLSVGASAAPQQLSVEVVDGQDVTVFHRATIDEVSLVNRGACGHRARVMYWRPLAAGGQWG